MWHWRCSTYQHTVVLFIVWPPKSPICIHRSECRFTCEMDLRHDKCILNIFFLKHGNTDTDTHYNIHFPDSYYVTWGAPHEAGAVIAPGQPLPSHGKPLGRLSSMDLKEVIHKVGAEWKLVTMKFKCNPEVSKTATSPSGSTSKSTASWECRVSHVSIIRILLIPSWPGIYREHWLLHCLR